jgi:hypothetical protein
MLHTHEAETWKTLTPLSYDRSALFAGMLVDICVWCVMLVATYCIVWRWAANWRQFRLRTLLAIFAVVAVLLGWWKYEHDDPGVRFLGAIALDVCYVPMLVLLQFPCYVYIPVLFSLGCSVYWIGWIGGRMATKLVQMVCRRAMPKAS